MCGRFTLRTANRELAQLFDFISVEDVSPRYNIAPTQDIGAIRQNERGQREFSRLHWGLIPPWAPDEKIGNRMINARAETIAEKTSFKNPLKKRRCLVLADGFYEWETVGKMKQPYFIHMRDNRPFAFAAIWERWSKQGLTIESCCLITTEPNELMATFHDRMPVILSPEDYDQWLDPEFNDTEQIQQLLTSYPAEEMEAYEVSKVVNSASNELPECVEPLEK